MARFWAKKVKGDQNLDHDKSNKKRSKKSKSITATNGGISRHDSILLSVKSTETLRPTKNYNETGLKLLKVNTIKPSNAIDNDQIDNQDLYNTHKSCSSAKLLKLSKPKTRSKRGNLRSPKSKLQ